MSKVHINLTIDRDVYIWLLSQQWKTSRSEIVNNFFKQMMIQNNNVIDQDFEKLKEELQTINKNASDLITKKAVLEEQIAKINYEKANKVKLESEKDFLKVKTTEENDYWNETISILEKNPEIKEGRFRYYNNVFGVCSFEKWLEKLDKIKGGL